MTTEAHKVLQAARRRVCRMGDGATVNWERYAYPKRKGQSDKESACQYRGHKRCEFKPWVGKIPWRRKWQPTPVILPEKSHRQRSLVVSSPVGGKESDTTEQVKLAVSSS